MKMISSFCSTKFMLIVAIYCCFYFESVLSDGERIYEVMDREGKYIANWEIEFSTKMIILELIVETHGYIGFGLQPGLKPTMNNSDLLIVGVSSDGSPYIGDFHGIGNTMPVRDFREDWTLLSAVENSTHTSVRVYRQLDTCDDEDVAITEDTMNMLWAIGETDDFTYHGSKRGSHVANMLDSVTIPQDTSAFNEWNIVVDTPMPNTSFSYWCTIHKSPFIGKNHIVGFKPFVKTREAIDHTHHFVIYKCEHPSGNNEIFGKFVGDGGAECYGEKELKERPTQLCKNILYDWGAGGKELYLPEHVGFPVGEKSSEYYMLEVHYNNPQRLSNIQFPTGVGVVYTPKLRKYDAGMFTVGHTVLASLILPPESKDFMIVGHCSQQCTQRGIPPEGVNIFNVLLHSHLKGRKMKLRHFRGQKELEWIAKDESYHFNFQKNRPLREERKLLPGDQLTFECKYDTSGRGNVTIAGFSTANEMCEVFIWYYPKIPMLACSSFYDIQRLFGPFGIKKVRWEHGFNKDSQPIVMEPIHMVNHTFAQYLNTEVNWTKEQKSMLQNELHHAPHIADCSTARLPGTAQFQQAPQNFGIPQNIQQLQQAQLQSQQQLHQRKQFQMLSTPESIMDNRIDSFQFTTTIPNPQQFQMSMQMPPPPEFVAYPIVPDYHPFSKCPRKSKRAYM